MTEICPTRTLPPEILELIFVETPRQTLHSFLLFNTAFYAIASRSLYRDVGTGLFPIRARRVSGKLRRCSIALLRIDSVLWISHQDRWKGMLLITLTKGEGLGIT